MPPLTYVVVEKERKQAEKNAKFAAKKEKAKVAENAAVPPSTSKIKEKKGKQEASKDERLPDYIEETPPGQKKSM